MLWKIGEAYAQGVLKYLMPAGTFPGESGELVASADNPVALVENEKGDIVALLAQELEDKQYADVWYVPEGVTSYDELDAYINAEHQSREIEGLSRTFTGMVWNIVNNEMLEAADKVTRLRDLITGFSQRIDQAYAPLTTRDFQPGALDKLLQRVGLKLKSNLSIKRAKDGSYWWYGHPTNNFEDRDGEILSAKAHRKFISYLDEHPDEAPELWVWHTDWTVHKHRASGWDFSDNMLHLWGILEEEEAERLLKWAEREDLAMSHGFWVYEQNGNVIDEYIMVEATVLPREYAANIYTDFTSDVKWKDSEGVLKMAMSKDRRTDLVDLFGEDVVQRMETDNEAKAAKLIDAGVQHKTVEPVLETRIDLSEDLMAGFKTIMQKQNELLEQLTGRIEKLETAKPEPVEPEVVEPKTTMSTLMELDPADGTKVAALDGRSTLAKEKPEETDPPVPSGVQGIAAALARARQPEATQ